MQVQAADGLLPYAQPDLRALIVLNKEGQSMKQMALDGVEAERERIISAGHRRGRGRGKWGVAESPGGLQRSVQVGKGKGGGIV